VEKLIDNVEMNLKHRRKKLIVDEKLLVKETQKKEKSRANWFKMQEERKQKEKEL